MASACARQRRLVVSVPFAGRYSLNSSSREQLISKRHAAEVAAEMVRDTHRKTAALFEQFPGAQVPDTFRVLAESNVAQTRVLYERSKSTVQAVLESWQKSFGAAGQGVVTMNVKMIDLAERNIDSSFDLATNLASARDLAEVMELQATYWRNVLGEFRTHQAGRARSSKARVSSRNR